MSTNSPHSAAPSLNKSIGYDPVKDFAPVARVGSYTLMLVLHPDVPATIDSGADRLRQGQSRQAVVCQRQTSGVVAGETLKALGRHRHRACAVPEHAAGAQDVLGGRVSMMFVDLTTGMPHVKADTLRALAVTRLQRSTLFPELPSLHEAGVANFDMDSWAGVFAPAHTPDGNRHAAQCRAAQDHRRPRDQGAVSPRSGSRRSRARRRSWASSSRSSSSNGPG